MTDTNSCPSCLNLIQENKLDRGSTVLRGRPFNSDLFSTALLKINFSAFPPGAGENVLILTIEKSD